MILLEITKIMSRNIPDFIQGNYYHVYNRGANKNPIFFEDENYLFLLKRLKKYVNKFSIRVIAYCLMPNHYHFLLRQDSHDKVGLCVQHIFNSYTKAINKKYCRSGTLFEGPYRAIHIDDEAYLLHLCRYIHRNPIEANIVKELKIWPYSNYLEWIGKRHGSLYDANFVDDFFPMPDDYLLFVQNYKPTNKLNKYSI